LYLVFKGIDTIGQVRFNGEDLGPVDDMFMEWKWEIKDLINGEINILEVRIKSPTNYAMYLKDKKRLGFAKSPYALPNVAHLRKAQYSFGWDWGAQLPDIGLWQDVEIIGSDMISIDSFYISQKFEYNYKYKVKGNGADIRSETDESEIKGTIGGKWKGASRSRASPNNEDDDNQNGNQNDNQNVPINEKDNRAQSPSYYIRLSDDLKVPFNYNPEHIKVKSVELGLILDLNIDLKSLILKRVNDLIRMGLISESIRDFDEAISGVYEGGQDKKGISIYKIYIKINSGHKQILEKEIDITSKVKIFIDYIFRRNNINLDDLKELYNQTRNGTLSTTGSRYKYKLNKKLLNKLEEFKDLYTVHIPLDNIIKLNDPELWWTHDLLEHGRVGQVQGQEGNLNHGQEGNLAQGQSLGQRPHLYHMDLALKYYDGRKNKEKEDLILDRKEIKFGIRDVKLVREKDKWGETFFFILNGVPIFAKGANWIPVDEFIPRGKKLKLYEGNLLSAVEANMNFLRVWGGGIYEDDLFYELCDELGILIWQDFPFACSAYPYDDEFIEKIKKEASYNIKRLRNHPALALWCGNNEIEQMFPIYIRNILNPFKRKQLKRGYLEIFEKVLPGLVSDLDPNRPYWPSSPSNGSIKHGGMLKSNSPNMGDSHYWMVWHGGRPFTAYRKFNSRFMSEFGFESFPSMKTISIFCPKEQYYFNSPIMENHQKNSAGNKKIMSYLKKRYNIPETFESQVILSQISQAEAMEFGVEHWRRNRNDFHCMGSLYWQLNDCWPVASWSSIDYTLRWKALNYFAKRFYTPVFPSIIESIDDFQLWLTNDLKSRVNGTIRLTIYKYDGIILFEWSQYVEINACSSKLIKEFDLTNILQKENLNTAIVFYDFISENKANMPIPEAHGAKFLAKPATFPLIDPELEYSIITLEEVQKSSDS
ncbi:MAG: glycosyl hydrolase 2 galactose-binding domain-containing protein, partial [Promethearchaeota archaeon]